MMALGVARVHIACQTLLTALSDEDRGERRLTRSRAGAPSGASQFEWALSRLATAYKHTLGPISCQ
jgi:hypothetical protein